MTYKTSFQAAALVALFAVGATTAQAADRSQATRTADTMKVIAAPPVHVRPYGGPTTPVIDSNGLLPNGITANAPTYG